MKLSDDPTRSEQNPILFPAPDGRLWLLHTAQKSGNQDTALVRYRVSEDNGLTWGPTGQLFETQGAFVRQPVVVLDNGDWLLGVFHCRTEPGAKWVGNNDDSAVRISTDQGKSWFEVAVPNSTGCVHMNIVKGAHGLLAFFRSRWARSSSKRSGGRGTVVDGDNLNDFWESFVASTGAETLLNSLTYGAFRVEETQIPVLGVSAPVPGLNPRDIIYKTVAAWRAVASDKDSVYDDVVNIKAEDVPPTVTTIKK